MDCHTNKCPPPNCSGKFNIYSSGCFTPLPQQPCSVYVQRPPCPQPPYPQPPCPPRPPYEHYPQHPPQYPQHSSQYPQYPSQYSQHQQQQPPQQQQQPPQQPHQPQQLSQTSDTHTLDRDKLQHQHQFQQQQQLQQIQQQQQHQQQLQQIQQQQLQQQLQQIQQQIQQQLKQQSTFPVLPPLPPIPPLPKVEVPPLPPLPPIGSSNPTCSTSTSTSQCCPSTDTSSPSQPTVSSIQILPYPLGYLPPPGTILHNTTNCLPPGYLECNGSNILRVEYATLFSMIGTHYGVGDTQTTFTLPNLQNKNTKPYQYIIRYDLQEVPTIVIKPHLEVIDVKVQGVDTICFS